MAKHRAGDRRIVSISIPEDLAIKLDRRVGKGRSKGRRLSRFHPPLLTKRQLRRPVKKLILSALLMSLKMHIMALRRLDRLSTSILVRILCRDR